jgi:hypothetical protein
VLGNVGTSADVALLARALDGEEPLVCEFAEWALRRSSFLVALAPRQARLSDASDTRVNEELRSAMSALLG